MLFYEDPNICRAKVAETAWIEEREQMELNVRQFLLYWENYKSDIIVQG